MYVDDKPSAAKYLIERTQAYKRFLKKQTVDQTVAATLSLTTRSARWHDLSCASL